MIQTISVWETVAASPRSTACITVPRMAMMKAAIIVLEWPGSRPCNAPSRIALGTNSHAFPVCSRLAKSVMEASQIRGELLQFAQGCLRIGSMAIIETVLDMVMDQFLFGLCDRGFDGVDLLSDLDTGFAILDHRNNRTQMAFDPFEALD